MRRALLLGLILLLIPCYFAQRHDYEHRVREYRLHHPSNERIEKTIREIRVCVLDYDPAKPYFYARVLRAGDPFGACRIRVDYDPDATDIEEVAQYILRLRVDVRQRQFTSPKNEHDDLDLALFARGIDGRYRALEIRTESAAPLGIRLRHRIRSEIGSLLRDCGADLLRSILLGSGDFSELARVRELGLAHILAVSGLHFSVFYALVSKLGALFRNRASRLASMILVMTAVLYLVKESYSAQRAYFMVVYSELCRYRRIRTDPLTSLAFSLIMILMLQPRAILSSTLQLSYYVYVIVRFFGPKRRSAAVSALCYPIIVQLCSLPITYYYFGTFNLYTFLANFAVLPLIGLLLPVGAAYLLLHRIPVVGVLLGACTRGTENLVLRLIGALPVRTTVLPYLDYGLVIVVTAASALIYVFVGLYRRKKLYVCAVIAAALGVSLFDLRPQIELTFFDVGHGDMALIRCGSAAGMIDTGDGRVDAARACRRRRVSRLDFLILSHAHADHVGGIGMLEHIPVARLYVHEETERVLRERYALGELLAAHGTELIVVRSPIALTCGGIHMRISVFDGSDENDRSLAVRLEAGGLTGYYLGDLSTGSIGQIELDPRFDFLKIAHHGSRTSYVPALFREHEIRYAVISHSHRYRMPSKEVEQGIKESEAELLTTYLRGEIRIVPSGVRTNL